ncbi:hypothetical protein OHT20_17640 [Streptomyces caniferus]|uniref:hypothetical protein n=1 Tax=Streptomyces caniferus TaxID=285557 RepID=UPI002E2DC6F8|nr:hypothetical protein [Streptomyces caniferus]
MITTGVLAHEAVVMPLPSGQAAGQRRTGSDGQVDEPGSLGETSRSRGLGSGNGIAADTRAWTTPTLRPGHYELA